MNTRNAKRQPPTLTTKPIKGPNNSPGTAVNALTIPIAFALFSTGKCSPTNDMDMGITIARPRPDNENETSIMLKLGARKQLTEKTTKASNPTISNVLLL